MAFESKWLAIDLFRPKLHENGSYTIHDIFPTFFISRNSSKLSTLKLCRDFEMWCPANFQYTKKLRLWAAWLGGSLAESSLRVLAATWLQAHRFQMISVEFNGKTKNVQGKPKKTKTKKQNHRHMGQLDPRAHGLVFFCFCCFPQVFWVFSCNSIENLGFP